ncbi:Holliday junction branch migration protein RuvA [Kiloniella laminariae]|uniref:Holliday junction branch migration complex subunit RuvA n=1 Tax=Kiloniella laminariae TaxID=454162 RepID=A0ABT4LIP5_9PROT|nr:Holliday junction branch migration protein RuvA [Kiloniella laminariae]MCZ4280815.1 Holliday junction branch migration protein RuvA [Kiloniella laminariae]
MIGKLTGKVDSSGDDWVMLDVGGVGYIAFCSSRTLSALPPAGEIASLLIETHVREDHFHLFGFSSQAEKDWYRTLSTVQGVGAKMALSLLSAISPQELSLAIAAQDKTTLTRANGVGPKLAVRIITELKDKIGNLSLGATVSADEISGEGKAGMPLSGQSNLTVSEDAVSALVNLGYRRSEAYSAVAKVASDKGVDADLEVLIKGGLAELMK